MSNSTEKTSVVSLTDSALKEIKRRLSEENLSSDNPQRGLRLGVKGGGCSGFSYVIDIDEARENDLLDEHGGVTVLIDPKSALYLKGITLDYEGGFMGSGFKFQNPQASNTCGCGESFSI